MMLDGKYRIERLIAVGGMGAVYLGTHIKLRKRVAIKVLNPQLSSPPMVERFHREAITASQIGHEGIAQVTDIGTSNDGEPFLVMEYLEGESLASRLRTTGPLALEDACELGCSILSPLAAAHRAGIIHRDLKPDNVFLVRQSRGEMVKLLDFGISRASGLESEFRLTTTGLVLGTPYYMSPEQARGESEITPAADLYAFGVILYEMLIADVPIRAENYNQLMYRVMMSDFARPRDKRPDLPEPLERIILQAMAQMPEDRQASAVELEQALLAYCRPAFRDRASGSISALPLPTPPPVGTYGTGSGLVRRSSVGTDHTVAAGSNSLSPSGARDPATGEPAVTARERPKAIRAARRSRLAWITGAIVLAAGIAGTIAVVGYGDEPVAVGPTPPVPQPIARPASGLVSEPPSQPQAPQVIPDAGGEAAAAGTPPAVPQATVTLRFAVEPAGAAVTVDGVRVEGAQLAVPRDEAVHTLRITAPGHLAHDETIRFDESQRLVVQLKRTGSARGGDHKKPHSEADRIDSESPY
jgi:serine/threonine-protein kinase